MPAATVAHPLGPPVVSGTTITVDTMLQQPTRVTRMIMDLTLQRFIADRVFASAGGVTGGAVVYDQAVLNELYADRDVQRVSPGAEFPIITSSRQAPKLATVEKWGGKVFITDEARDRNNTVMLTNQLRQLANTIVRKINARAVAELEASITAFPSQTFIGQNWANVVTAGTSASSAGAYPAADFAKANQLAEQQELGVSFNLWLMNPTQLMRLQIIYGDRLQAVLGSFNARLYTSNRVPVGVAYVLAEQQVGELRLEKPLGTETWREEATERTWIQSSVRPIMYVTNPYSVIKVTGLGA
jgi:hypothetical protein